MAIQINPNVAQLLTQQGVTGVQEKTLGKGVSGSQGEFRLQGSNSLGLAILMFAPTSELMNNPQALSQAQASWSGSQAPANAGGISIGASSDQVSGDNAPPADGATSFGTAMDSYPKTFLLP